MALRGNSRNGTPFAFDNHTEDFEKYFQRCVDHMAIDFHRACGSMNSAYVAHFKRCWCSRDVHRQGLLHFDSIMHLAAELQALGYASWEVDALEEADMRAALGVGLVTLRDLCLYAERDEQYVVGPEGEETVERLVGSAPAPQRVPGPWSGLDVGEETCAVAHLLVDLQSSFDCSPAGPLPLKWAEIVRREPQEVQDRVAWYVRTWQGLSGGSPLLPWSAVATLLQRAVEERHFSRFARRGCERWGGMQALEAAWLLHVKSQSTQVSFLALCCVVEAPEPSRLDPQEVERLVASPVFPWTPRFHGEVIEWLYPGSRFRGQVQLLLSAAAAQGVCLPRHVWHRVISFMARDLQAEPRKPTHSRDRDCDRKRERAAAAVGPFASEGPAGAGARIPVKVRQALEKELAPLQQYRKRMEANQRTFPKRVSELPVEVCVDGDWVPGTAKEYVGRSAQKRKVRVQLEDLNDVVVHLGKVVLREGAQSDSGGESGSEAKSHRRRRSRSRGRKSPDWSRYKGRSDADMVEELREKAKEDAVCGHGKAYARRPLTVEEELWKREPEMRVSMLGDENRSSTYRKAAYEKDTRESESARRRRLEEEDERQKRLRGIYEKYGSSNKSASSVSIPKVTSDIDLPDVLRLG